MDEEEVLFTDKKGKVYSLITQAILDNNEDNIMVVYKCLENQKNYVTNLFEFILNFEILHLSKPLEEDAWDL